MFRFVHGMIGANAALERSYHVLSQLAKETRETVSWVELDNDEIVVIGNVPSVHLRLLVRRGTMPHAVTIA